MGKYEFYLVGRTWFSEGCGGSNTDRFPSLVTTSADEAEQKFRELEAQNEDWSYSFSHAYLVGVLPNKEMEFIKGKTNPLTF